MRINPQYTGTWRFTEMSMWDQDYIDMVAPGHISIKRNGTGTMAFGVVEAELDCRPEKIGDGERLAFSFSGWDEGDELSGRGWAVVNGTEMNGWFAFHLGDESTFKAHKTED